MANLLQIYLCYAACITRQILCASVSIGNPCVSNDSTSLCNTSTASGIHTEGLHGLPGDHVLLQSRNAVARILEDKAFSQITRKSTAPCEAHMVQRRRRNKDMCACRRRTGSSDLDAGWTCTGDVITMTGATEQPIAQSAADVAWYGKGRVTDPAFWEGMRGIGFSPADDRGEWYMSRQNPSVARLDDTLTKIVENGYNMVRTWRTGDYEDLVLQHIRDRNLSIKVQLGVDIEKDWNARDLIDQAARVALKYPDLILGMSVGNERMYFGNLNAEQVREHALYARKKYGVPVTYNFVVKTITHSRRREKAAKAFELCEALDYVNVHLYGGHYSTGRYKSDWTPSKQVKAVIQQEKEVAEKIGYMGKPMIIGESGWQSTGYAASSVAKLREYYILITRHVYSQTPDSPALAMFYFNMNDEAWKGGDDHWGLYEQGDENKIGDWKGDPKFKPTNVIEILEAAHLPKPDKTCCAALSTWTDVAHGATCGNCAALVSTQPYQGRCDKYCESFGHVCVAAAEELNNNCEVLYTAKCDQQIAATSDMLCVCSQPGCDSGSNSSVANDQPPTPSPSAAPSAPVPASTPIAQTTPPAAAPLPTPTSTSVRYLNITAADLTDRISGFWVGQLVGNFMGLPFEFQYVRDPMPVLPAKYYDRSMAEREGLKVGPGGYGTIPQRLNELQGAYTDDDTDIEFVTLHAVTEHGLNITYPQIAEAWKTYVHAQVDGNDALWFANLVALQNMYRGLVPPATGQSWNNRYWWTIDPQLVNEIWSVFYPGMVDKAVEKAEWGAKITSSNWGTHPTLFYAALYSAAFVISDIQELYDLAIKYVPASSPFAHGLAEVKAWYLDEPVDWRKTRALIYDKYRRFPVDCGDDLWNCGVSAMINGLLGAMALLYGEGDFMQTLGIAIAAGYDCDNQAATLAGLIGTMHGLSGIPRAVTNEIAGNNWSQPFNNKYINERRAPLPRDNTITDIVASISDITRIAILKNGGSQHIQDGSPIYSVKISGLAGPSSQPISGGDPPCCGKCGGEAWCSPNSGNCYTWKKKDYYDSCCCSGCGGSGYCSPVSSNCYDSLAKPYYRNCTSQV